MLIAPLRVSPPSVVSRDILLVPGQELRLTVRTSGSSAGSSRSSPSSAGRLPSDPQLGDQGRLLGEVVRSLERRYAHGGPSGITARTPGQRRPRKKICTVADKYSECTVKELKKLLRANKLKVTGRKSDLRQRLLERVRKRAS